MVPSDKIKARYKVSSFYFFGTKCSAYHYLPHSRCLLGNEIRRKVNKYIKINVLNKQEPS